MPPSYCASIMEDRFMNRMFALACLALLAVASSAQAATPGVNLSWSNCATTAASGDKTYACDGLLGNSISVQGSFRPAVSISDFAGVASVVDIGWAGAVPDYWKVDSGQCNANALTVANPTATAPCVTTNIFESTFSGGGFSVTYLGSGNRMRLRIDWATGAPVPPSITAGNLYPAFKLTIDPDQGVNNACAGCATPACMVFQSCEVFGLTQGEDEFFETADVRQSVTWQGGAIGGAGCPADVPTQNRTWGQIKSMYR
jgi:hypothetical protein